MKKLKLTIEGMHCASCSQNIERSLKKVPGVKEVSVSVMTNKGFVEAEDNVDKKQLEEAVEDAGSRYKALKIEEI